MYRIVQYIGGEFIVATPPDVIAWANICGVEITGYNSNPRQRIELQGQPRLKGFCGPMWDGDAIRYEDPRSNDILSA